MLSNLTIKKNITTFSVSPENLTGEKGKGKIKFYIDGDKEFTTKYESEII